ncbi:L,D-transpeptidase family protein [Flavobacterium sp. NST-5]|uniref:L,D-transpeptidase family protein n=1 Tax=Flavobacterium ichthyis TaxID=2698827 RepID=A0ABW9Z4M0_9FLAO|nr:L,D-transpeptidase family protein [Flavobacterium ichthyis]NBL63639.1 L,D-transpeptidase family protein [Flavobacterium ichthyis]
MTRKLPLIVLFFCFGLSSNAKLWAQINAISEILGIKNTAALYESKVDSSFVAKFQNDSLAAFYQKNNFKYIWTSNLNQSIVVYAIQNSRLEGLNPKDYFADEIVDLHHNQKKSAAQKQELEVLLTFGLQKLLLDRANGRKNPHDLYEDWDLKQNKIEVNHLILSAISGDSLSKTLVKLEPKHPVYFQLKNALQVIEQFPDVAFDSIFFEKNLKLKDSGNAVLQLKNRLTYWKDLPKTDSINKKFDEETDFAVKKFQKRHGLFPDGIVGPATIKELNYSKSSRKEQIIANLERWRWFPRKFSDHYILLNIPEYKIHLINQNDTIRTHNVIVGTAARKTPILSSKLSYVVLNPTWTVPPTILREDIIPAATKNRSYFSGKNIKIYNSAGKAVSPWSWIPEKANNYRYVQSPGTFNSLGMVKIIFPNHYSVYLHDTNHREYFDKENRSLSSGCVRVQDPLELTEYLLDNNKDWSFEKITEVLQNGKTQNVKIKNNILIHQLYWTAWSEENTLHFRPDIYNLDLELYRKLGQ